MTGDMQETTLPNGPGAASLLAASVGCVTFALLAFAGDKSDAIKSALVFYKPTGALSGVSTLAVLVWIMVWGMLEWRWRQRNVAMRMIAAVALVLLGLSFLLTFPPVVDLL